MNKKKESTLGLAPLGQLPTAKPPGSLALFGPGFPKNHDAQRILDEWQKEGLVIDATRAKDQFAMTQIAEMLMHSVTTFEETSAFVLATKNKQRDSEHQAYVDEFCNRAIQMFGGHILSVLEVGATNIGAEVHRSLYPLPEQSKAPEHISLWKRLFG